MIEFTKGFKASDGKVYGTLAEAQEVEVRTLLEEADTAPEGSSWTRPEIAEVVVANKSRIIDILTTTETSRPKARAANGGRKPRKPKAAPPTTITASETAG